MLHRQPDCVGEEMNNLVIVAHADDEILNMGGTLHQLRDEFWMIVCVTKDIERGRDLQFREVCVELGADYAILGFEMGLKTKWDDRSVAKEIDRMVGDTKWDRIFTHNFSGEYGHFQHKELHRIIECKHLPNMVYFGHDHELWNWVVALTKEDKDFKYHAASIYSRKEKDLLSYDFFHVDSETFRKGN